MRVDVLEQLGNTQPLSFSHASKQLVGDVPRLMQYTGELKTGDVLRLGRPLDFNATQQDLADALGLSLVHINKTVAQLKKKELIGRTGTKVVILNWEGLQEVAGFDPAYLHFKNP